MPSLPPAGRSGSVHHRKGTRAMGCNCGGGGRSAARAAAMSATGVPVAWRLKHPSGGTVDYYVDTLAYEELKKVPGGVVTKVDVRTGQPVE